MPDAPRYWNSSLFGNGVSMGTERRAVGDEARLFLLGRNGLFSAVVEPNRDSALIGAIILEDLDFLVDSAKARLVPRDPDYVVNEIE